MAAVLCQSIGSLLSLPCRACGTVCGTSCHALFASPFAPYLITTLLLNVPPVWWGLKSVVQQHGHASCQGGKWLLTNSVLCLLHILAAFYIIHRIQTNEDWPPSNDPNGSYLPTAHATEVDDDDDLKKNSGSNYQTMHDGSQHASKSPSLLSSITSTLSRALPATTSTTATTPPPPGSNYDTGSAYSWQRLRHILCYDPIMALYMLCALVWLGWQTMGVGHALDDYNSSRNVDGGYCDRISESIQHSLLCGFLYSMLVCLAFSCSVCCLRHDG